MMMSTVQQKLTFFIATMVFLYASLTAFAQEPNKKERENPFVCLEETITLSKTACFTGQEYTNLLKNNPNAEKILEPLTEKRNDKICIDLYKLYKLSVDQKRALREIFTKIEKHATVSIEKIYSEIKKLKALQSQDAHSLCVTAELMKRVGDYQAEEYYKKAIDANESEPAYELFYADYLRNFRGPQRPLFPEAEEHYYEALRKLGRLKQTKNWQSFDHETERRVERGLITLYQEDGLPFLYWKSNSIDKESFLKRPFMLFSAINKYTNSTTNLDEVDDVRDFTSEALFASSKIRLNRSLTEDELKEIIRTKEQFETLNRLRFRHEHWPIFDVFYKYREINNAQITNFFEPNKFNDVNLNEYGIAIERPFNFSPDFDLFLRGIYKKTDREGIIEFLPDRKEDIDHYEVKAAISRFLGPNKINLEFTYVFQDIDPDINNPPKRDRQIFGTTLTFLQPLYELRFETRGLEIFGGLLHDKERYGDVDVKKNDYFMGSSLKGFKLIEKLNTFDITIQPTVFTSEVGDDKSQDNFQYRTNVTLLYRILDEEKIPGIPKKVMGIHPAFLHLVIPFRHDIAIDGPKDFENFKVGIELNTKSFIKTSQETKVLGTTFWASLKYDYQRFYRLDKDLNLYSFNISIGF